MQQLIGSKLSRFPLPPPGRSGWPWTEESPLLPQATPDGKPWPKISIVTPSFNYGPFLEETIRSVLLQNYPNLEYIIIDGGSTDNSIEIIKKYQPWLAYWVSEGDKGQADAINKGIAHCSGEIFNWINSDDYLAAGALRVVAEKFGNNDMLAGAVRNFDEHNNSFLVQSAELSARGMIIDDGSINYHQPGSWVKLDKLMSIGCLDATFHYCFDWLMTIRYLDVFPRVLYTTDILVNFRLHSHSKTVNFSDRFSIDRMLVEASLLLDEKMRSKYGQEIYTSFLGSIRVARIDKIKNEGSGTMKKVMSMLRDMSRDITTYPYRYTLGAIRRLIFRPINSDVSLGKSRNSCL
jgi:glycosyltransferase involved in cell wall biosynthesis